MKIVLQGNLEEVKQQIGALAAALLAQPAPSPLPCSEPKEPQEEKPKAAAKSKAAKPPKEVEAPAVDAPSTAPSVTKQHVADALQAVSKAKSLVVAREVLASFDASRISDLKEEVYADFVAACNKAASASSEPDLMA